MKTKSERSRPIVNGKSILLEIFVIVSFVTAGRSSLLIIIHLNEITWRSKTLIHSIDKFCSNHVQFQ